MTKEIKHRNSKRQHLIGLNAERGVFLEDIFKTGSESACLMYTGRRLQSLEPSENVLPKIAC